MRGPVTPSPCGQIEYRSQPGDRYTVVTIIWAVWLFASGSAIRASLGKAQVKLQGQPYNCYQFANLLTLWQVRSAGEWVLPVGAACRKGYQHCLTLACSTSHPCSRVMGVVPDRVLQGDGLASHPL